VPEDEWDNQDLRRVWNRGFTFRIASDATASPWWLTKIRNGTYDVSTAAQDARASLHAESTPHGFFWRLPHGQPRPAAKFLRTFGPLTGHLAEHLNAKFSWVNLTDFWRKQLRFQMIMSLWLTLDAPSDDGEESEALRSTWSDLAKNLEEINAADPFPIGSLPGTDGQFTQPRKFSWERAGQGSCPVDWVQRATPRALRQEAKHLILYELDCHSTVQRVTWRPVNPRPDDNSIGYRMLLQSNSSLWEELWALFALDTSSMPRLRLCPHCDKLFYAPRKDRFYCTPELQSEFSRNRWWRLNKEEQLSQRRKSRNQ
jgi:hypothetical protein